MSSTQDSGGYQFTCTECDWAGPGEDVEWGEWLPAGYRGQRMEPTKNDCPECGGEVEA